MFTSTVPSLYSIKVTYMNEEQGLNRTPSGRFEIPQHRAPPCSCSLLPSSWTHRHSLASVSLPTAPRHATHWTHSHRGKPQGVLRCPWPATKGVSCLSLEGVSSALGTVPRRTTLPSPAVVARCLSFLSHCLMLLPALSWTTF